jgi:hypothetical protein
MILWRLEYNLHNMRIYYSADTFRYRIYHPALEAGFREISDRLVTGLFKHIFQTEKITIQENFF